MMLATRQHDFKEAVRTWSRVSHSVSVIHNERDYRRAVAFLDFLMDSAKHGERDSLADLLEVVGMLVKDYEDRNVEQRQGNPVSALKLLMEEHELTQADLKELGSQGVVSEILAGKRKLNVRQIKSLSKRFHVSPSVFIDEE